MSEKAGKSATSARSAASAWSTLRISAPWIALAAVALVASNCSDSASVLCPPGTQQAGVFNTTLTFNTADPNQCYYGDGGSIPDASLSASNAPFTSAICSALDGGQPLVYLALPAFDRVSVLGDGGTFAFGSTSLVTGTSCSCNINVIETITGTLTPVTPGAVVQISPDGGLPPLSGFTGMVIDQIDAGDDAGVPCTCNLPCDLQYSLSGVSL